MSVVDLYRRAVEAFEGNVRQIKEDQWNDPTPCAHWDVRTLVNHIVYENKWVEPLIAGKTVAEVGDAFDGDLLGEDPIGAFAETKEQAFAALDAAPDLADRTVHLSWGDVDGETYLKQLLSDNHVHGWDLARAIGADEELDEETSRLVYEAAKPIEDTLKASGSFGDKIEVAEDADLQTKLLAVFGRRA